MREFDLNKARWRKSSYSDGNGGNCLEVADGVPGVVPVRDSKLDAGGPVIVIGAAAWTAFLSTGVMTPRPA
ncbi:DUF397 domain-containing protein [Streptomyces pilosus]|uniref:DUF397 domain-containing protein n=1 Tax=Streptomyces pilosus TaxID=28893 RepID=A0A918BG53_9ACTN|nr:DUF397 domain-containing protein [Streptomyces pilosus]GGQ63341.1 hypothetical protein GCM10010280_07000 [Streptomyces pilosus]GGV35428.1 hypothetical protein GCM10010261_04550 [Streptomyces pilosus]